MINSESQKKELYQNLLKYLKRSAFGDDFASEMLIKLINQADFIDKSIYDSALDDFTNFLPEIDNKFLGQSISHIIRVKYTDFNELDEFFELYKPKEDNLKKYTFDNFCNSYGYNPDDIILLSISGNSMIGASIEDGDTAVVNISKRAKIGEIAAIHINNKYYIKRIDENAGNIVLLSENPEYLPYTVSAEDKFKIIGLVTNIIKRVS